jgi:hypothetical protein
MNNVSRETLERLREATFLSDEEWSDCLQLSPGRYQRLIEQKEIALSDQILEDFSELIDLTPEAIISGKIDFKVVAKRQEGHAAYLPERYSVAAHSKVRTSSYLLDYVEIFFGWRIRNRILRQFQLNESVFANLDRPISVNLPTDLCAHLKDFGLKLPSFYEIGKYSVVSNANSAVGEVFRKIKTPKAAYEKCFNEIVGQYYDQNFIYSLEKTKGSTCVVSVRPNPKVLEELGVSILGNSGTCASRGGTFASIMGYLSASDADVTESTCIHRGDSHCTYIIDFEKAERSLGTTNRPF